jgi:hypothetical protein
MRSMYINLTLLQSNLRLVLVFLSLSTSFDLNNFDISCHDALDFSLDSICSAVSSIMGLRLLPGPSQPPCT